MRYLIVLLFTVFLMSSSFSQKKQLCITIDDLPLVSYSINSTKFNHECTDKFIKVFKKYNLSVIGYVNESKLYTDGKVDSSKVALLEKWLNAGCDLGNHTFSHLDFNKVSYETYFNEIIEGEKITRELMTNHGKELKYFRHPYLHTGQTKQDSDTLHNFLSKHGYVEAPVTIDNDDYLFAYAYHKAHIQDDDALKQEIRMKYVQYQKDKIRFFEEKSKELFGREIAQTLLIHANLLNADCLEKLVKMYQKEGYVFVSQEEVLKDVAYRTTNTFYSKRGSSWVYRWAYSLGRDESITKGDPQTPQKIIELTR